MGVNLVKVGIEDSIKRLVIPGHVLRCHCS